MSSTSSGLLVKGFPNYYHCTEATLRYCPVLVAESEGRLAAIVDFTFNLGAGRRQTSTLRRRINQRDRASAACELRRRVYGGGKVLPGLVVRREVESALLVTVRPIRQRLAIDRQTPATFVNIALACKGPNQQTYVK